MFFDVALLKTQHKGALGYAWIAATRGIQHIKEKDLAKLKVEDMCVLIMEFLNTESASPRKRFSLRLSVMLINGVIKILRKQTTQLQNEVYAVISQIRMPQSISTIQLEETGIFMTPPTPIRKIKRKKKHEDDITATPLSELERIGAEAVREVLLGVPTSLPGDLTQPPTTMVAREADITMREEITTRVQPLEELDIEPLGEIPEFFQKDQDELFRKLMQDVTLVPTPPDKPVASPDQEQILPPDQEQILPLLESRHAEEEIPQGEQPSRSKETQKEKSPKTPRQRKKKDSESTPSTGPHEPVKIQVEAQIHAPPARAHEQVVPQPEDLPQLEDQLQREVDLSPTRERRDSPPIQQVPEEQVPETVQQVEHVREFTEADRDLQQVPELMIKEDKKSASSKAKKVKGDPLAPFLVSMRQRKTVCIDRCAPGVELFEGEIHEIIVPSCNMKESLVKTLYMNLFTEPIAEYNLDIGRGEEQSKEVQSLQNTISLRKTVSHSTPADLTESSIQRLKRISTPQDTVIISRFPPDTETPMEQLEIPAQPFMSSTPLTTRQPFEQGSTEQRTIEEAVAAAANAPARHLKRKQLITDDITVPERPQKKKRTETAKLPEVEAELPRADERPRPERQVTEISEQTLAPEVSTIPELTVVPEVIAAPEVTVVPEVPELSEVAVFPSEVEYPTVASRREDIEQIIGEDDVKQRQQDVIDIIINWKYSDRKIKISDLCQRPVNRVNIAKAFGDLLLLCRCGYVELISEEEPSVELDYIKKGRKLLDLP